jgi:predicted outer membrane repeat protein
MFRSFQGNQIPRFGRLLPLALAGVASAQVLVTPPVAQASPQLVPTAVIVVDPSGHGNYLTITAAVAAAPDGAEIRVRAGTYRENGIDLGYKNLVLVSFDGQGAAIIDGMPVGGSNRSIFTIQHFQTSATVINGFKMINARAGYGGAIMCTATSPSIINNTFENNSAAYGGALYAELAAPLIAGNTFAANGFGMASASYGPDAVEGGAVELRTCSSVVQGNLFSGNRAGLAGGALTAVYNSSLTVDGNWFYANTVDGTGGTSANHGGAMAIFLQSVVLATHNTFSDNTALRSGGAVWFSGGTSLPAVFDDNQFSGNVAQFQDGGGVWCDNSTAQFHRDIFSGNSCGIEGGIGGGACCSGAGASLFQSCRFTGNFANSHGGGIACAYDADVTISRSSISNNDVADFYSGSGAGVYVVSASVTLRRNLISGNGLGNSSSGNICHRGGGIDYLGGTGTANNGIIEGNVILGNEVQVSNGAQAGEGAGVALHNMGAGSRFVSNVVAHNFALTYGCKCVGVLIQEDGTNPFASSFRFGNNTIAFNQNGTAGALGTGGGVMFENVANQFNIVNCIIWNNVALNDSSHDPVVHSVGVPANFTPVLDYCDVSAAGPKFLLAWQWATGAVKFNNDPLFVDGLQNFHLQVVAGQVLVDAGNNAVIISGDTDMDGQPRINPNGVQVVVDIGADET